MNETRLQRTAMGMDAAPGSRAGMPALNFAILACAACYGQSDSPLAKGMNWGIFSLLGVIMFVLGCLSVFFVYLGKKSAASAPVAPEEDGAASGVGVSNPACGTGTAASRREPELIQKD